MPLFDKILIANRGEIACRVIKTARRLGISTVAVHSEADRHALHVQMADEAVAIGPPPAAESYLLIDRIIEAARETGAQAIHPGYGFLSENKAFAEALEKAGIAFIGPNVKAIEVMGDKIASKRFAADADVSTVPGYLGVIKDAEEAVKIADEIGYPVMIKASAGGGGKGMRIANSRDEVKGGFGSAVSEAKSSFGDDRVFIEKFIEEPRHIEIQVLADKHGNVIHLGERECSIQRRNQKVIEEAPSPFLDEETRAAMGAQAVALAESVDYESAGTVEFIVDRDKHFYFLEMNTRLQVEHPVTELITGIDLVEQMIRVAAGEKLEIAQSDVTLNGWAVESRIYAEDPFRDFLPSIGRLVRYRPPEEATTDTGLTVRNDTGVFEGGEISLYYDPMIAKLVTHGPSRDLAIDHMARALDAFHIDGIQHNIPFLASIMQHPRWREGRLSTSFIADEFPDGFSVREASEDELTVLISVAAAIDHMSHRRRRQISQQSLEEWSGQREVRVVKVDDHEQTIRVLDVGEDYDVGFLNEDESVSRSIHVGTDWWFGQPIWIGRVDGVEIAVQVNPILNGFELSYRGVRAKSVVSGELRAELSRLMPIKEAADTSKALLCPMPGLVVRFDVAEGDTVKAGQPLCVVEAMKMENVLTAERDAVIGQIHAQAGDSLAVDEMIMEFE